MIDESTWSEMENAHPDDSGWVRRRVLHDRPYDMFVEVEQPSRMRTLTLHVHSPHTQVPVLPDTRALVTTTDRDQDGSVKMRIALVDPTMKPVFTPFVDDVIEHIAATDSDDAAVGALVSRFDHWRNLLSGGPAGMGPQAARGLFAELWTMQYIVALVTGLDVAVAGWTGPDRTLRDFTFGAQAVEVKSTKSRPPAHVTVSSELQLNTDDLDRLILVALELDEASGANGDSLPDLVALIRSSAGVSRDDFDARLMRAGYLDDHARHYARNRFVIRHVHMYEVRGSFPRLLPSDLPAGVGTVTYRLSLGACEPWATDVATLKSWLDAERTGELDGT